MDEVPSAAQGMPVPDFNVFGWPYTQHETYYLMVGGDGRQVFLGLRDDADPGAFHQEAHDADAHGRLKRAGLP